MTHPATWIILDGTRHIGTSCGETERIAAEDALLAYVQARAVDSTSRRDLFIYFVTADAEGFPVKIGMSETFRLRLSTLQSGLPYEVKVLAVARIPDTLFERRVHRKFAATRLRGEWFQRTPELLTYAEHLANIEHTPMNRQCQMRTESDFTGPQ